MSARGDWRPILSNAIASGSNGRDAPLSGFCWFARARREFLPEGPLAIDLPRKQTGMTGQQSAEFPNMAQRAVMQYLSLDDWKVAARLPIPAGELMLSRIRNYGWIEIRGEKHHTAIKLTAAGFQAMRSAI